MIRFFFIICFFHNVLWAQPIYIFKADTNHTANNFSLIHYKSEPRSEYNLLETVLNRVYFGSAQDMIIYRNTLLQSTNTMGLGMFRASIPLEQNLHLLMFKEYIYKVGMVQQTFQLTPYIGIRKRF